MRLWNRIKLFFYKRAEAEARMELYNFMLEEPFYRGPLGDFPIALKRRDQRQAYKQELTATYTYQEGDDLLATKQDFIDKYTVNEQKQLWYFTQTRRDRKDRARCHIWRNHEQVERREAQKAWYTVAKRNYHTHMRQKFMAQKTR